MAHTLILRLDNLKSGEANHAGSTRKGEGIWRGQLCTASARGSEVGGCKAHPGPTSAGGQGRLGLKGGNQVHEPRLRGAGSQLGLVALGSEVPEPPPLFPYL